MLILFYLLFQIPNFNNYVFFHDDQLFLLHLNLKINDSYLIYYSQLNIYPFLIIHHFKNFQKNIFILIIFLCLLMIILFLFYN